MNFKGKPPPGSTLNTSHWLTQKGRMLVAPFLEGAGTPRWYHSDVPHGRPCRIVRTGMTAADNLYGLGIKWGKATSVTSKTYPGGTADPVLASDTGSAVCLLPVGQISHFNATPTQFSYAGLFQPTTLVGTNITRLCDTNIGLPAGFYLGATSNQWGVYWNDASHNSHNISATYAANDWIFLCVSVDNAGNINVYLNGTLQSTGTTYNYANSYTGQFGANGVTFVTNGTSTGSGQGEDYTRPFIGNISSYWYIAEYVLTANDITAWMDGGLWQNFKGGSPLILNETPPSVPAAPSVTLPVSNGFSVNTGGLSNQAQSFNVLVSTDNINFSVAITGISPSTWTPVTGLLANTLYYVQTQAVGYEVNASSTSATITTAASTDIGQDNQSGWVLQGMGIGV